MPDNCYCGSSQPFENCCEPLINGDSSATTAEQLMRARFSAYATAAIDFLEESLHPDSRSDFDADATRQWAESSTWNTLKILETTSGGEQDKVGIVSFTASFTDADGKQHQHSERSQFKKSTGQWYFCDGQSIAPDKVGRNDPCPCGSGKKYKKCCGKNE